MSEQMLFFTGLMKNITIAKGVIYIWRRYAGLPGPASEQSTVKQVGSSTDTGFSMAAPSTRTLLGSHTSVGDT